MLLVFQPSWLKPQAELWSSIIPSYTPLKDKSFPLEKTVSVKCKSLSKFRPSSRKQFIFCLDEAWARIIKDACYDCHSHETKYPWYASVAPVSWWIGHYIEEARGHLNFSTWAAYDAEKKAHKAEECAEEVEKGLMPLKPYAKMHSEARLSDEQRERLISWFKSVEEREKLGLAR